MVAGATPAPDDQLGPGYVELPGQPLGTFWGPTFVGVNGQRTFSDGTRTVQVHFIQDSIHAQGFLMAWQEMALFGTALVAALATFAAYGPYNQEAKLWIIMLLVQSIPYGAALATSLVAVLPGYRRAVATPAPVSAPQALNPSAAMATSGLAASFSTQGFGLSAMAADDIAIHL